jgi:hypothetical protein
MKNATVLTAKVLSVVSLSGGQSLLALNQRKREKPCSSLRKSNDSPAGVEQFAEDQIPPAGCVCEIENSDLLRVVASEHPQSRL